MSELQPNISELQRLGEGYKDKINNPEKEKQIIQALMTELSE